MDLIKKIGFQYLNNYVVICWVVYGRPVSYMEDWRRLVGITTGQKDFYVNFQGSGLDYSEQIEEIKGLKFCGSAGKIRIILRPYGVKGFLFDCVLHPQF